MYNLVPLILISISLLIIIVIVVRKFSFLASLDVDSIPGEKEARFKESVAGKRIKRSLMKWNSWAYNNLGGFLKGAGSFLVTSYDKLFQIKESYDQQLKEGQEDKDKKISRLFNDIGDLDPEDDFEEVEKKLIEIVGLDSKNIDAFQKLGDLYFDNKKFQEAKETYGHILKLVGDDDVVKQAEVYYDMAMAGKENKKDQEALENMKKVFSLTPNNPKYLDIMFEVSIINKDEETASKAYNKLTEVNPENKKLEEFKERLENLSQSS